MLFHIFHSCTKKKKKAFFLEAVFNTVLCATQKFNTYYYTSLKDSSLEISERYKPWVAKWKAQTDKPNSKG